MIRRGKCTFWTAHICGAQHPGGKRTWPGQVISVGFDRKDIGIRSVFVGGITVPLALLGRAYEEIE
jgi:hypothetical protein